MFDARLLQTLLAVAEHKSFVRAAEALHATQPGVSQHIAKLETHFGVKLFTRGGGLVELTAAGAAILAHAHTVLASINRLEGEAEAWAQGYAGALHIGLSSAVLASDLPTVLRKFKQEHPQVRFEATVRSADELGPLLDLGVLDAMLTTLPSHKDEHLSHQIGAQRLGVAVPADHPLASRESAGIEEFFDEPFIVVPRNLHGELHDKLIARFHDAGRALHIAAQEVAFPSVLARVALGEGVGLVPARLGDHGSGAVIIPLDDGFILPIYYVTRGDLPNSAEHLLFNHLEATSCLAADRPRHERTPDETRQGPD
ncbi:LysR family transcriptional regulator [Nonomuraea sp. FMUSA5-5]|uniref:LysR family transcriptional regulator n=1 Tax=Nonomuraea composti TaxID=2720023 RepID=A0ABX1BKN0_9ACTN|nr:LysR family transcriptional regulator [Nonomuraea sp. FMUSA5-5]NJP97087.1 LysR family transcriptional regulator [Nonomuraea sp. FMUSA5-5]